MSETIRTEILLPHPPARVWQALTDQNLLSRWLMATDFRPEVGAQFSFDTGQWGITRCEVITMEPPQHLRYTWVNPPLNTTVTWTLIPDGTGTRLVLEHAGFDLSDHRQRFAYEGMKNGWGGILSQRLVAALTDAS